jgi:hypothetical protein
MEVDGRERGLVFFACKESSLGAKGVRQSEGTVTHEAEFPKSQKMEIPCIFYSGHKTSELAESLRDELLSMYIRTDHSSNFIPSPSHILPSLWSHPHTMDDTIKSLHSWLLANGTILHPSLELRYGSTFSLSLSLPSLSSEPKLMLSSPASCFACR